MALGVGDLLVPAHLPFADRRDHLQFRRDRGDGRLDPHLIVALAGAAVGDGVGVERARGVDGELGQQWATEAREWRVAALVAGVGEDRRPDIVAGELVLGVDQDRLDGPEIAGLLEGRVEVVGRLAEVDAQCDHFGVVLILDPLEHHRRVESAGVEQDDAVDVFGPGDIRSGLWSYLRVRHK